MRACGRVLTSRAPSRAVGLALSFMDSCSLVLMPADSMVAGPVRGKPGEEPVQCELLLFKVREPLCSAGQRVSNWTRMAQVRYAHMHI